MRGAGLLWPQARQAVEVVAAGLADVAGVTWVEVGGIWTWAVSGWDEAAPDVWRVPLVVVADPARYDLRSDPVESTVVRSFARVGPEGMVAWDAWRLV